MKSFNILVTGCGGDISQSMGKILKTYSRCGKLIGCDIHEDHAGHFIFDKCFVVERASSPLYLKSLSDLIQREAIDILVPATEYELELFLSQNLENSLDCLVIRPNNTSIEVGLDKLLTAQFLEENNLPFPKTSIVDSDDAPFLPCIVKARRGSGSKSVHVVKDMDTYRLIAKITKDSVCQEYLGTVDDEFTCGVFRTHSGIARTLIFRRKLTGGYSGFGTVEKSTAIEELLEKVAVALNLTGSINVQLRMHHGVPMIFEINARFSSTVLFRHLLGFEDLIWSIEDKLAMPLASYQEPAIGSKFYKGFQEYIIKA